MDYGKSPRATPLIVGDKVLTLGAMGDLSCLDIETGLALWTKNFEDEYDAKIPTWGFCGSPIMIDSKNFVVQPGTKKASLVALNIETGKETWRSPGKELSYSSFILVENGPVRQIVGYDSETLGGWDAKTGKRLWTVTPERDGDFNVPTPIIHNNQIVVSSENNGTRIYQFDRDGKLNPKPIHSFDDLSPDTHTPVISGGKVFGISGEAICLDRQTLKMTWSDSKEEYDVYCAAVADQKGRVLTISSIGKLVLLDISGPKAKVLGKMDLTDGQEIDLQSHPAFLGSKMFVRLENEIVCLDLNGDPTQPAASLQNNR